MSINPVLGQDSSAKNELCPLPQPGEVFVLKREGIAFVASNSDRKLCGHGKVFLTNRRLVFLRDGKPEKHKGFTSIELPLNLLRGSSYDAPPTFKQPIFGANYLEGKVEPAETAPHPLAATSSWTLTFNKGGCQTFLQAFYRLHKQAVSDPVSMNQPHFVAQLGPQLSAKQAKKCRVFKPSTKLTSDEFYFVPTPLCFFCRLKAAFYDPGDPSVLYLVQPTASHSQVGYQPQVHQPQVQQPQVQQPQVQQPQVQQPQVQQPQVQQPQVQQPQVQQPQVQQPQVHQPQVPGLYPSLDAPLLPQYAPLSFHAQQQQMQQQQPQMQQQQPQPSLIVQGQVQQVPYTTPQYPPQYQAQYQPQYQAYQPPR